MSTEAELLFLEMEDCFNFLTSLSCTDDEDMLCFEATYMSALRDYKKALNELKSYVKSKELQAQAGGVM
jgi:hypothetical protein